MQQHNIYSWEKKTPQLPYILYMLDLGTKGCKNVDFSTIESGKNVVKQVQEKWAKHFNDDITFDTVTSGFENMTGIARLVYQHLNYFRILHRRTVHNTLIKMGISETSNSQNQLNMHILNVKI